MPPSASGIGRYLLRIDRVFYDFYVWRYSGKGAVMKEIKISQGKISLVDDADYSDLSSFKWSYHRGYAIRHQWIGNNKKVGELMHRRIMGLSHGDSMQVDHIDGNKLNNRRENLRICTRSENMCNVSTQKRSKTGFKGVSRNWNKFRAQICINGKSTYLGVFETAEEAHEVYCLAADMLHGEFANYGGGK